MRILHLSYDSPGNPWLTGGKTLRTYEINRRLGERHDVEVVCGSWNGVSGVQSIDGIRYRHVGNGSSYLLSRLSYTAIAARTARTAECDVIAEDLSGFSPLFTGYHPKRPTALIVCHLAGDSLLASHGPRGRISQWYENAALRCHRNFVVISESTAASVRARAPRIEKLSIIHCGYDESLLAVEPTEEPFLLFVGRMEPHMKGLDLLFPAFAQAFEDRPDIRLVVTGYGDPGVARDLAQSAGARNVDVRGPVSDEVKADLLRKCLAVVMPSRYEGWGIVAMEAAACAKPVIGQRVPGLVDSVVDGQTGILVPYEDVGALAEAIQRVVSDDALRRRLGTAARVRAARFTWDRAAEEQEAFYLDLVGRDTGS
jgi:glycosyltransferase involved in cell wall biosynthesis